MANFAEELGLVPPGGVQQPPVAAPGQAAPLGEAAPQAAPLDASPVPTPAPEGRSMLGRVASDIGVGITEAVPGLLRGASKGLQEMDRAAFDVGNWLNDNVADLGRIQITRNGVKWVRGTGDYKDEASLTKPLEAVTPGPATTVTGGMVEGVSQFLTSFALGGRLLGVAAKGTAGTIAISGVKSMFAGAAGFDPAEERFSNLLQDHQIGGFVTDYLAHQDGDTRAEGRFKNALEQTGMNLPVEALFLAVKGIRAVRAGKVDEAHALSEQVARELDHFHSKADDPNAPVADERLAPGAEIDFGRAKSGPRTTRTVPKEATTPLDPPPERVNATGDGVEPYKPAFEWNAGSADELIVRHGNMLNKPDAMAADVKESIYKNLARVETADDAKYLAKEMGRMAMGDFERSMGPSRTIADYEAAAQSVAKQVTDYTGGDWRDMVMLARGDHAELKQVLERVLSYRVLTEQATRRSTDIANAIIKGDLSAWGGQLAAAKSEFVQALQLQHSIAPTTEGIKSELGRNLSMLRGKVGPDANVKKLPEIPGEKPAPSAEAKAASDAASPKAQAEAAAAQTKNADLTAALSGDTAALDRVIQRLALADNPKAAIKVSRDFYGAGLMDVHNELLINALLSGLKTSVVNTAMGLFKSSVVMPTEQLLAGVIKGDPAMMRMAADQYAGFYFAMKDAIRVSGRALKVGDAILDPSHQGMGNSRHAIVPETFGLNEDTPLGAFVSGMGALVRLPSRLLTTQDEFLKQLNYRARLYAIGKREARAMKESHGTSDVELADFMSQHMERGFDASGAAVNPEALAWARDATFTNDLKAQTFGGGRSFGEVMSELTANHPALRAVMPFVRVPTNIMRDAWDHTPGMNLLRSQFRAEMQAGGERAALAKAKMLTGGSMWAGAIMMAYNGDIVGSMPSDPNVARTWREAGIVPNSVRYEKEDGTYGYWSFGRGDPYATFLSLAGTFADMTRGTEAWRTEDIASGMAVALAKNLESKTYLQGLVDLLGVIGQPEQNIQRFMQQRAAAYIPQVTNTFKGADYLSDPHTMAQAMLARTANYGKVDRRFNSIGEPVQAPQAWGPDWLSPIAIGNEKDGALTEIARLATVHKGGIGYPAKKIGSGSSALDMTELKVGDQSAYARLQELTGTINVGGGTLRSRLEALINSPQYRDKLVDGEPGTKGSRLEAVSALIQHYREGAKLALMRESPEFNTAFREHQRNQVDVQLHGARPQQ